MAYQMRSPHTGHTASCDKSGWWHVSWLGGQPLSHSQAKAAMRIAEEVSQIPADCDPEVYDDQFWARVGAWAAELGLTAPDAVVRASGLPRADGGLSGGASLPARPQ